MHSDEYTFILAVRCRREFFTHKVHSILRQPVEALQEEQQGEECDKAGGEIVPEHGEGQARFRHRVPGALDEVLPEGTRSACFCVCNTAPHQLYQKGFLMIPPPFRQPLAGQKTPFS